jgi:hypothetical protein
VNRIQILSLVFIAGYFLFLVFSLRSRGRLLSGPWLFLLRSFFPNWRFYHALGPSPRLFLRSASRHSAQGTWTEWQMFMPRAHFHWSALWHNPRNNLMLAHQNLIDHLSFDIQALSEDQKVASLVSYQLTERLALHLLQAEGRDFDHYQFQLRWVAPAEIPEHSTVLLSSPALEA